MTGPRCELCGARAMATPVFRERPDGLHEHRLCFGCLCALAILAVTHGPRAVDLHLAPRPEPADARAGVRPPGPRSLAALGRSSSSSTASRGRP